jgi:ADP-ribose pyrophosphatase YjhB (NUDIX family)
VLLVREREDGRWTLPGGWTDIGQTPAECALRELREESGYDGRVVRLLAVLDRTKRGHDPSPWHIYKLYFECDISGEPAASTLETDAVDFFAVDALPELSTGRITADLIRLLYDRVVAGERDALFD